MPIFMEGEAGEAIYFVKQGKVKIFKNTQDGKEHIIHIMTEGEVFAEACLFSNSRYPANAEAIEDSEVLMIKNKDIEELILKQPTIGIEIIKVMAKRLMMVSKQIEYLALQDAYGKTASLLIKLIKDEGLPLKDGIKLKTSFSRQEMGNMVGLSRETFTRALSKLRQDKAIEIDKDEIIIISVNKLKSWVQ
ncbi:Crp/Fnr family transcriptional regulator [Fervidicella metallireducens]|uniref:Crp/Fnr family transcriptional regulator n=1 Tax=Fervidicella metallireducens TaxID=655338 RepID=UPI00191C0CD1|nr:Crp/Fnr family transcriptional regulator [Fervidicella metallireducens]